MENSLWSYLMANTGLPNPQEMKRFNSHGAARAKSPGQQPRTSSSNGCQTGPTHSRTKKSWRGNTPMSQSSPMVRFGSRPLTVCFAMLLKAGAARPPSRNSIPSSIALPPIAKDVFGSFQEIRCARSERNLESEYPFPALNAQQLQTARAYFHSKMGTL